MSHVNFKKCPHCHMSISRNVHNVTCQFQEMAMSQFFIFLHVKFNKFFQNHYGKKFRFLRVNRSEWCLVYWLYASINKMACHMSLSFQPLCPMSISPMLHVKFKKSSCSLVDIRGLGPSNLNVFQWRLFLYICLSLCTKFTPGSLGRCGRHKLAEKAVPCLF